MPATQRCAAALGALLLAVVTSAEVTVIQKDVAVLGGGASGAYSAVRLREDLGLSVVLIEKEDILV
jgi:heterodisulfide reductase subunit A-like polyferredoxin